MIRTLLAAVLTALTLLVAPPVATADTHAQVHAQVQVQRAKLVGYAVVGDSNVYGSGTSAPAQKRWPVLLGLPNIGRPGLALTTDETPAPWAPELDTLDQDLIALGNPTHLVVMLGTNDLRFQTVYQLIAGYQQLAARLAAKGVELLLPTVLPRAPFRDNNDRAGLPKHAYVNDWIRESGIEYVDLDVCVGTPNTKYKQLRSVYDSGDHVHLNDAGHQRAANCIAAAA